MSTRPVTIILGAALCVASFISGLYVANWHRDSNELAVVKTANDQTDKTNHQRVDAKDANLLRQRDAQRVFHDGVSNDTAKTDELLQRVLRVTDGMQQSATSNQGASTNHPAPDTSGAEAREARLRGALRLALTEGAAEAKRANEVTRLYNLCLSTLESDRQQVEASRSQG